ncbi:ABC transporter permease [Flexivirga meconopsidis]|uniref:ABC transporter permease n=1 Tax=Flexivirga meconopsidis TaxID=2977121 RepID=UPI0022401B76|nr:ABC transporter permease [Flexivirga meconopsidis]
MAPTLRFELAKLLSQWRVRIVLIACWVAPGVFVAVVSQQSSLPTDTVFGRWMHATGWAGPLVVLSFCCTWALPLLTALVAGDVFAAEDRLGTWRHLLVSVRSARRIFATKAIAAVSVILVMVLGLAVSAVAGGLLAVGNNPLVGLDGHQIASGEAARLVGAAWLYVAVAALAFAAVGLLGSVAFGRSPMGLLLPAVLAICLQLLQMLPLPVALRMALPSQPFLAWRGLFTTPAQLTPMVVGLIVSLAWTVAATAVAYLLFRRRDFTDLAYDGAGRRVVLAGGVPLVALTAIGTAAVAAGFGAGGGSGVSGRAVEQSIATAYGHLYRLQSQELHRPDVPEAQLRSAATCTKGGATGGSGPGNDWRCVVTWRLPGVASTGSAIYQLDVQADGKFVADGDGPPPVNGYFQVRTPAGDSPNPLWQIDGLIDLLDSPKG